MRWIVLSLVLLLAPAQAQQPAAPTLVTRLVKASNELEQSDPTLEDLYQRLKKLAGFERYQQLERQVTALQPNAPVDVPLGKDFRVTATYLGKTAKGHRIKIHWVSGKTVIASEKKVLKTGGLLIKGPEVGKAWIILAVAIRD